LNIDNPKTEFQNHFFVEFIGESVNDLGNIRNEYFDVIVQELFNNSNSYFENKKVFWFNPTATDEK
jgi:hypothetical protein